MAESVVCAALTKRTNVVVDINTAMTAAVVAFAAMTIAVVAFAAFVAATVTAAAATAVHRTWFCSDNFGQCVILVTHGSTRITYVLHLALHTVHTQL